jgi:D-arabinose 1-dehydrogenase-like Zn-dependent alcohol dehydrogenase
MDIPKTCKVAVCESEGAKLVIKELPVPEPQKGEILIKVHACGVCHSDSVRTTMTSATLTFQAAIKGEFGAL